MTDLERLWVWRDPGLAGSLGWYAAVAANRRAAKFRAAAAIPASLPLAEAPEPALWEELERLTPVFLSCWSEVRDGGAGPAPRAVNNSLLYLCQDTAISAAGTAALIGARETRWAPASWARPPG